MASSSTGSNEGTAGSQATTGMTQAQIAQRNWEVSNQMETITSVDEIYQYDRRQQQDILQAKPWEKELVY